MANLKLISADLSGLVWASSGGDATGFPAANLNTYIETETWKSIDTSANQYIYCDMNADLRVRNAIAVIGHNWNGIAPGGVKVQSASNSAFTTSVVDHINPLDCTTDPIIFPFPASPSSNRWWRVLFLGTPTTAPRAGQIFFDKVLDFGYPYDFPYRGGNREYRTVEKEMLSGHIRTHQSVLGRRRFSFSFKANQGGFTDTVKTDWQVFYKRIRGKLRPFFLLDVDGTSGYYVHFDHDEDPTESYRYNINGMAEMKFKEAYPK